MSLLWVKAVTDQAHLDSLTFRDSPEGTLGHKITAHDESGEEVGRLEWAKDVPNHRVAPGMILKAQVKIEHQRKGVATEMLRRAREIEPKVNHSPNVTEHGKAFSEARP